MTYKHKGFPLSGLLPREFTGDQLLVDFPHKGPLMWSFFAVSLNNLLKNSKYNHVIKWIHFPRNWPFVRGIHRLSVKIPSQRPVTRSFYVSFDLRLNKRLSKQSRGWSFEMLSRSLWRHCNGNVTYLTLCAEKHLSVVCVVGFPWYLNTYPCPRYLLLAPYVTLCIMNPRPSISACWRKFSL